MPIYEYECSQCGQIEEAIQNFSDAPLSTCNHCSGKLNKLISQSTFHLKGSGWYVTDYANKSSKATSSSKKKADSPSAGSTADAATSTKDSKSKSSAKSSA